jgi:AraC-like DNA-binding protein
MGNAKVVDIGTKRPGRLSPRAANERMLARNLRLIVRKRGDISALVPARFAHDPETFLAEVMPVLDDFELRRVSARAVVILADIQSLQIARCPFRGGDWRVFLFCLVNSRSLREAINRAADLFEVADGRMGSIELSVREGKAFVAMVGERSKDEELSLAVIINAVTMYHEIFGWLVGTPLGGEGHLDFPEAARAHVDEPALPFALSFGASSSGFSFPVALLDLPVVRTSEDCTPKVLGHSLFAYTEAGEPRDVAGNARRIMRLMLQVDARLASLDQLGDRLGFGRMTLRRRLAAAGTSYQAIKDAVRHEYALELLERTDHSIEDLAVRLDYCDSDAFRLAVKSWTGTTPTKYRQRARSRGGAD